MFVTVNRRIQGKAQMKDKDPVLAYLAGEDEPFEWLMGMICFDAHLPHNRSSLIARANSYEVGLAKLAEYLTSEEESDEESPKHSSKKKTSFF